MSYGARTCWNREWLSCSGRLSHCAAMSVEGRGAESSHKGCVLGCVLGGDRRSLRVIA